MNTWLYLLAGGGLFALALLLLWISGNKPGFIPDFPINILRAAKPRSLDSFLKPKKRKPKKKKKERIFVYGEYGQPPIEVKPGTKFPKIITTSDIVEQKKPVRFSKGMDIHDWQIVRNNNIREIARIKDPVERIKKLDALEKRSKKYMHKDWVAQGLSRYGYQLKVEAKHEIKEKSHNQLIKDVYNVSDGTIAGLIKSNQLKEIEQVQHRFVTFVKDSKDITNNPEYFSWQTAWDMFERQDPELQAKKEARIKELNRRSARQAAEALTKSKPKVVEKVK